MIPITEALKIIKKQTGRFSTETIDLENSIGRVLAEDIFADVDLPPFNRSQMDGFAVRVKDLKAAGKENPTKLKIIGESVAGKGFDGKINSGETVRIMTGAPVPNGADSVQKKELAREFLNDKNEHFADIFEPTKLHQNINLRAAEIEKGAKVCEKGEIINEQMIAPLASFGYAKIKVAEKPKIAILATGSEIVDVNKTPKKDQIRNSNSIALKVFAEKYAAQAKVLPIVKDDASSLKRRIFQAVKTCDILIISGGVSVGDYDFTKPALRELGAEIFFEKVSLRPGKPTVFAKLNDTLVFGLPGNPVSVAVTFHLFVRQAILLMQDAKIFESQKTYAVASQKIKAARERDSFLPVFVETDKNGKLVIKSLEFGGSSNFIAFSRANALVFVPHDNMLEAGDVAEIMFL